VVGNSGEAVVAGASHRPWPVPPWPWALAMRWHELLFMHWPLQPAVLRPLVPPPLEIDTFDGTAWIGVIPFYMTGVRPHYAPALPWASAFAEINVRTYVTIDGKPGVWFFSLDAANPLAVRAARLAFHLPYYDARMTVTRDGDTVRYTSRRIHRAIPPAELAVEYRPTGPAFLAPDGSLERWLTERYCLYAANWRGRVWRGEIRHARWPLQPAEAEIARNTMADPLRLALPARTSLLHFAQRLDVVAWTLVRVQEGR
jgi:uncharacterized protein YqjF (DUF2071 family)